MSLQEKYAQLITAVKQKASGEVNVTEKDNVLYIDGSVGSDQSKDDLWKMYNVIDPDYRSGDLRLNHEIAPGASSGAAEEYVVKSGDSLSKIGAKYGLSWKELFEANKDIIKNPDLIQPGWKLKIPAKNK